MSFRKTKAQQNPPRSPLTPVHIPVHTKGGWGDFIDEHGFRTATNIDIRIAPYGGTTLSAWLIGSGCAGGFFNQFSLLIQHLIRFKEVIYCEYVLSGIILALLLLFLLG